MKENIIDILEKRELIEAISSPDLREIVNKPITLYVGFDPTADSLHLGHLLPIIILTWFQKCGHNPIAIVGGATGCIGDPSGRSTERNLLNEESLAHNLKGIRANLEKIMDFQSDTPNAPIILNNMDWFKNFSFITFLRDVGKHFRMGSMLAKESVKLRLESEEGMSFTEFSYQMLQAYDFLHLNEHYNVMLQCGGSDQWGNITAGIELVRKLRQKTVYGATMPLLTRSDGKKFGKSESGAIWLSAEKLSPYAFYQYLFGVPDSDVIKMMKRITFMELEEIALYEKLMHAADYIPNTAQKRLAEEVTRLVHGEEGVQMALQATALAAPGAKAVLDRATLEVLSQTIPTVILDKSEVLNTKLIDLLVKAKLFPSKGEVRRMMANGGIYLNEKVIDNESYSLTLVDCIEEQYLLVASGKKKKIIIKIQ
ncbi:MAG: tyrosine--tRNA ligase, chloroplastic/mitochondrial-like [Chlamydiales bacterium]|nr:tyrosine--tRNA ligase, chloroplastic/mitochondrial-like [Chlamydiales bacterium]